jgi:hypothetical protein
MFFFCLANALFGQYNESRQEHRIVWTEDDYTLRYEVLIEKEDDELEYHSVLREFTEESFIVISLPPGNYRLRVIPYDFRNVPGEGTNWKDFKIVAVTDPDSVPQVSEVEEDAIPAENQEEDMVLKPPAKHRDLFFGLFAEGLGYSRYSAAFGGGIAFGGSFDGMGVGLTLLYAQDAENFIFMEALAHYRLYFSRMKNNTGPFLQAEGGIVLFAYEKFEITEYWSPAAGLSAGWRFPLGTRWYIEPSIRGGYPYIFGASLSAGMRFD